MRRFVCALALFVCAAPLYAADAIPFNLLLATKGDKSAYFLPTIHQSNQAMQQRLAQTVRCMPEIDAIVFEVDIDEAMKKFNVTGYSVAENKKLGQRLPAGLLAPLDDLADKVLPPSAPRKGASAANRMGMHPAHFLAMLNGNVNNRILREHGINLAGSAFEAMLHGYAGAKKLEELHLEAVDTVAAAHVAIPPQQLSAQAAYLLRLADDKKMQDDVARVYADTYALFERGDWTQEDVQGLNAAMRATQPDAYVANAVLKRTRDMMASFEALPPRAKPVLVAVGLGHFGKTDGIEAVLAQGGYTLRRHAVSCRRAP